MKIRFFKTILTKPDDKFKARVTRQIKSYQTGTTKHLSVCRIVQILACRGLAGAHGWSRKRTWEEEAVAHTALLGCYFHRCALGEVPHSEVFWVYTVGRGHSEGGQGKGTPWGGWNQRGGGCLGGVMGSLVGSLWVSELWRVPVAWGLYSPEVGLLCGRQVWGTVSQGMQSRQALDGKKSVDLGYV